MSEALYRARRAELCASVSVTAEDETTIRVDAPDNLIDRYIIRLGTLGTVGTILLSPGAARQLSDKLQEVLR